jgi:dGTPase
MTSFETRAENTLGRLHDEPESDMRSPYQRDRDRIIHSAAFRRLEYKTQVLANFEGDHFRTRLTHSLEVAQIARTVTRCLGGNEDLAEAIALAHDLGHPPFGHSGELMLDELLADHGGFDHNIQAFRLVTRLERKYASFDGLNLTAETLEGIVKHGGALEEPAEVIASHSLLQSFGFDNCGPLEAQVAAIADDIAYISHDLDDGLRGGFFRLDDVAEVAIVGERLRLVDETYGRIESHRRQHELVRRLIDYLVNDLVVNSAAGLRPLAVEGTKDLRSGKGPVVTLSPSGHDDLTELRRFLKDRMYRNYKVNRMSLKAQRVIRDLFSTLIQAPDCLPADWQTRLESEGSTLHGTVRDYIAGMTDRFALDEHERLFELRRSTT